MKKIPLAHLALFATNIIYGLNYNIAKWLMPEYIQPFGFIFCRVLFAGLLFWMFASTKNERKFETGDYPRLLLCGLFGVAMNQLMFFHGLNLTSPVNASIIMTITPVLVLIFAAFIIREKVTAKKLIGIAMGIGGALMIIIPGSKQSGLSAFSGDWFIFLNAASYAVYLVIAKPLLKKYDPIQLIKWVFLFGFFFVFPFGFEQFMEINWSIFSFNAWLSFAFVIIGTSFIAYLFNAFALKNLNASAVSIYIYLQPLTASVVAIAVGESNITFLKLFSALLIFIGVFLVSNPKLKAQGQ